MRILKCCKYLTDIFEKDRLLEAIEKYHLEKNHRGIGETYEEMKNTIYYPNLKLEIHKFINNCIICNMCKFDRNPTKLKLCLTETPSKSNEVVHIDIWYLNKVKMFLTCIDKLTKHVSIHSLPDRNSITIVDSLNERFALLGKPVKIVADNEFNTAFIKNFLSSENVEFHFTSPNTHTGNSDIERFHLTLNEHIRIFRLSKMYADVDDKTLVFKAVQIYNNTIHSATKQKPCDLLHNHVDKSAWKDLQDIVHNKKEKYINKINKNRASSQEFGDRELVKNLGFQSLKQKPKYIIKTVKEKGVTNFLDEKGLKRDRQIVKRKYKHQKEIEDVNFDRKITGRNRTKRN